VERPIRSIVAAKRHRFWLEYWRPALVKELHRLLNEFKALRYVPFGLYVKLRREYGAQVILGHLVVPFKIKLDALGAFLRAACRITFSDQDPNITETFATCADPATVRLLANLTTSLRGQFASNDVAGAYYYGTPTPVEEGGRAIFARVPPGLEEFGFPEVDPVTGERMLFHIPGNLPGIKDAGLIWEREYTSFLRSEGFYQSVADRRLFVKRSSEPPDQGAKPLPGGGSLLALAVVVDDTWITSTNSKLFAEFMDRWGKHFKSSTDPTPSSSTDFAGIHCEAGSDASGRRTMALSCGKSLRDLEKRLIPFPLPVNGSAATPMVADGLAALHADPSEDNPLIPESVPVARQLLGLAGWITGSVRADAHFAYVAIAQRVANHLTRNVWSALLRLCHYLVTTQDITITYKENDQPWRIQADVDSSLLNAPESGSFGGYTLYFPGSGPFAWNCTVPRKLTDSSGGAELVMSTIATKAVLGWRIVMRELGLADPEPTNLRMDATAPLLGTASEKVARNMRYLSARYAIVRDATRQGETRLSKVSTSENLADPLTKPLPPASKDLYMRLMRGDLSPNPTRPALSTVRAEGGY
jgi:hypothetical protein